ncbi:MAG: alpha/beta hydrolase [Pseudomonadota bacterium]
MSWRSDEDDRKLMTDDVRDGAQVTSVRPTKGATRYQLDGDPSHPLLLCIHGWTTSSYVWDRLREELIEKNYRLLTYDSYGRGFSDRPEGPQTAEFFLSQLDELLDNLGLSDERLNVIGYSMGGAIAAKFVSRHVERFDRLLLIAPAGMEVRNRILRKIVNRSPRLDDLYMRILLNKLPDHFRSEAKGFESVPEVQAVVRKQIGELEYQGYLPALLSSLRGIISDQMEQEHRAIARSNVAVRALFGKEDETIPHEQAKKLFNQWNTNSVSVSFDGVGHGMPYTHPDLVLRAVEDFL